MREVDDISVKEMSKTLKKTEIGKSSRLSDSVITFLKMGGEITIKWLRRLFIISMKILEVLEEWRIF